jgi:hypothetical protein
MKRIKERLGVRGRMNEAGYPCSCHTPRNDFTDKSMKLMRLSEYYFNHEINNLLQHETY